MLKYECEGEFEWTHLKFSPNGKMILISTNTSLILLVDAFSGVLLHTFTVRRLNFRICSTSICFFQGHQNTKNIPLEASFSPDSKYIFCGLFFSLSNRILQFLFSPLNSRFNRWSYSCLANNRW
jgi:COMPASS component SWD2